MSLILPVPQLGPRLGPSSHGSLGRIWLQRLLTKTFNYIRYSCNKIIITQIQISCQNWNGFFSNISHQMMIQLIPIVSRAKSKWYKPKRVKKLALNLQLLTIQILTNDVQMLILCLSYSIILYRKRKCWNFSEIKQQQKVKRIYFWHILSTWNQCVSAACYAIYSTATLTCSPCGQWSFWAQFSNKFKPAELVYSSLM